MKSKFLYEGLKIILKYGNNWLRNIIQILFLNVLIGFLLECTIGAILGGGIYLLLKRWGHRHIIVICILCGLIMWIVWEVIYTINIEGNTVERRMISGYLNHFINTILLIL